MSRFVSMLMVVALIAAACSGGEDGSTDSVSGDTLGDDVGGGGDPVTLTLWAFEGEEAFFPTLIERFEATHSNVSIEMTEIPEDSYTTKVDTALAAGSPPDLGLIYEPRWLKAGSVLPLDDEIEEAGLDLDEFNQNALSGCQFEGTTYCLGSYVGAVMLFYNKELFDSAGVDYPSATDPMTIDEFADRAGQLSVPSEELETRIWGTIGEAPFWWSDPASHFSDDGRSTDGYVNDEATVNMYRVMAGLVADGHAPTGSEFELLGGIDLLATGQVAMAISDNLVAIEALEAAGYDWGAAPVPVESADAPTYVASWTDQVGVFASSENADLAREFAIFVADEGNRLRTEIADQLPLNTSIAEASAWAEESEARAEVVEVVSQARPAVFVPGFWEVTSPLWDVYDGVVAGDISADEGLDEAAPIMQETLDRAWETWEEFE